MSLNQLKPLKNENSVTVAAGDIIPETVVTGDYLNKVLKRLKIRSTDLSKVEYRGTDRRARKQRAKNPDGLLNNANLIFPGQKVWVENDKLIIANSFLVEVFQPEKKNLEQQIKTTAVVTKELKELKDKISPKILDKLTEYQQRIVDRRLVAQLLMNERAGIRETELGAISDRHGILGLFLNAKNSRKISNTNNKERQLINSDNPEQWKKYQDFLGTSPESFQNMKIFLDKMPDKQARFLKKILSWKEPTDEQILTVLNEVPTISGNEEGFSMAEKNSFLSRIKKFGWDSFKMAFWASLSASVATSLTVGNPTIIAVVFVELFRSTIGSKETINLLDSNRVDMVARHARLQQKFDNNDEMTSNETSILTILNKVILAGTLENLTKEEFGILKKDFAILNPNANYVRGKAVNEALQPEVSEKLETRLDTDSNNDEHFNLNEKQEVSISNLATATKRHKVEVVDRDVTTIRKQDGAIERMVRFFGARIDTPEEAFNEADQRIKEFEKKYEKLLNPSFQTYVKGDLNKFLDYACKVFGYNYVKEWVVTKSRKIPTKAEAVQYYGLIQKRRELYGHLATMLTREKSVTLTQTARILDNDSENKVFTKKYPRILRYANSANKVINKLSEAQKEGNIIEKIAVAGQDFKTSELLKKTRETLVLINEAIEKKDHKKAAELEKMLNEDYRGGYRALENILARKNAFLPFESKLPTIEGLNKFSLDFAKKFNTFKKILENDPNFYSWNLIRQDKNDPNCYRVFKRDTNGSQEKTISFSLNSEDFKLDELKNELNALKKSTASLTKTISKDPEKITQELINDSFQKNFKKQKALGVNEYAKFNSIKTDSYQKFYNSVKAFETLKIELAVHPLGMTICPLYIKSIKNKDRSEVSLKEEQQVKRAFLKKRAELPIFDQKAKNYLANRGLNEIRKVKTRKTRVFDDLQSVFHTMKGGLTIMEENGVGEGSEALQTALSKSYVLKNGSDEFNKLKTKFQNTDIQYANYGTVDSRGKSYKREMDINGIFNDTDIIVIPFETTVGNETITKNILMRDKCLNPIGIVKEARTATNTTNTLAFSPKTSPNYEPDLYELENGVLSVGTVSPTIPIGWAWVKKVWEKKKDEPKPPPEKEAEEEPEPEPEPDPKLDLDPDPKPKPKPDPKLDLDPDPKPKPKLDLDPDPDPIPKIPQTPLKKILPTGDASSGVVKEIARIPGSSTGNVTVTTPATSNINGAITSL